eukprot:753491-Pyramimonas_sp.AAC.1
MGKPPPPSDLRPKAAGDPLEVVSPSPRRSRRTARAETPPQQAAGGRREEPALQAAAAWHERGEVGLRRCAR